MTSPHATPAGPLAAPTRTTAAVYALDDAHRVTIVIDASATGGSFDLLEVLARPGGDTQMHRHAFIEWFHVLEGTLRVLAPSGGTPRPIAVVEAGATYVIPADAPHSVQSATDRLVRYLVASRPGVLSSFIATAGVRLRDAQTRPTEPLPGPARLAALATSYGIEWL